MLDIKLIREKPDLIRNDLNKRKDTEKLKWVDIVLNLDKEWREQKYKVQDIRNERNKVSMELSKLKKEKKDVSALLKNITELSKKIGDIEAGQDKIQQEIKPYLMRLPNILHESVPFGEGEEGNQAIEFHGDKPKFDFKPKSHVDLLETLDIADIERAAKISGSRFYFLKGDLALLELALQRFGVDFILKKGFTLFQPPLMMNRAAYEGVTDLGDFESVMYKIDGEDLYLIATSEHPLTAQFMDEKLDENLLPLKLAGISSCYRKEAGSHGKDTKGIFRVHHFNKVEQIVVCRPDESWQLHEELIKNAKEFFQKLELHFRVINICTGDIGTVAAKKYDIEVWMPAQEAYREVVSCSNCTDYQARRLNITHRVQEDGKTVNRIVHTLNSTLVATSRALVAIMENYQDKEGNIHIPKALLPYMNGIKVIKAKK